MNKILHSCAAPGGEGQGGFQPLNIRKQTFGPNFHPVVLNNIYVFFTYAALGPVKMPAEGSHGSEAPTEVLILGPIVVPGY